MRIFMSGNYDWDGQKGGLWAVSDGSDLIIYVGDETGSKTISACRNIGTSVEAFGSLFAKSFAEEIQKLSGKVKIKNSEPAYLGPGLLGKRYTSDKSNRKVSFTLDKYDGQFAGIEAKYDSGNTFYLGICQQFQEPQVKYVKLQSPKEQAEKMAKGESFTPDDVAVRSLEEIALMGKDISWLKDKQYYVVTDESQAEQLISFLETYNGLVSVDYETTGLRINRFGEIGSPAKEKIDTINRQNEIEGKPTYRVDTLVGIIFCVQKDVGYYLPMANRKFKNLYSDPNDTQTIATRNKIKAAYTIGEYRNDMSYTAQWVRNHDISEFTSDITLMLRIRRILETRCCGAHHGSFEYKCSLMYGIDMNLTDDSMLLHQLLFKFKNAKSSRGNPSDLKTLTKVEFGIDQLSLEDFFVGYREEIDKGFSASKKGRKKKSVYIDFSYMTYDGVKAYGPADGDFTLQLIQGYKYALKHDFDYRLQYLYAVEILVACAIGYMEFHGHRIDERKIRQAEIDTKAERLILEEKIRDLVNYNSIEEKEAFNLIRLYQEKSKELGKLVADKDRPDVTQEVYNAFLDEFEQKLDFTEGLLAASENPLNLNAPNQVATLFYDQLGLPLPNDGKYTVEKRAVKPLAQAKDKNGNLLYPVAKYYLDLKNCSTLLSKFFGALQYFMYPDGFIFSQYGQITTATGRMSCSRPNAQQYPKSVTKMVIPRDGCVFIDADYSQIEYRTMVALAHEGGLLERFRDPDMDYHTTMASLMFGVPYADVTPSMRSDAKTFNFGIPYGMGIKKLAFQLVGREDQEAVENAKQKRALYFKEQPNVERLFENIKESANVTHYTETKWGRRRTYNFIGENGKIDEKQRGSALRQAGNAVIQGTAADIYKIGVARFFTFIRKNNLFSKVFITNMIHDEQLVEVDFTKLSVETILGHLIQCMQLELEGFPPMFVGAGVDKTWANAKGKYAEIHPLRGARYEREAMGKPLECNGPARTQDEVVKYFEHENYVFRENKVLDYVKDPSNYGQALHPIIAALMKLQFDAGVKDEIEERKKAAKDAGHPWTKDQEFEEDNLGDLERLNRFIKAHGLDIPVSNFQATKAEEQQEEDVTYEDDEDNDFESDAYGDLSESSFKILSEDEVYGCRIEQLIKEFKYVISPDLKICGIYMNGMKKSVANKVAKYLDEHITEKGDPNGLRVAFVTDGDMLQNTDFYVSRINEKQIRDILANRVTQKSQQQQTVPQIQQPVAQQSTQQTVYMAQQAVNNDNDYISTVSMYQPVVNIYKNA